MEKQQLISTIMAAQSGDNDALNTLFNEYYNDLYYFALKTVKDEETALDVTQEAFVEIINTLSNLKEPAAFVTWAKQITYHQCTRYFKKKKDVLVDEDEDGNTVFDTLQEENAEFIPDEALDQSDFKKTIIAILDELSEEQRSATMMYYFDEMSVKQIAEIQGVSEGTVKSRLNYARKAIKNSVEEYEKKNGIKLHAIPFFPFFKWLFEGSFEGGMPMASAELVAEGVATATGTTVTVATAAATTGGVVTTTASTATAVGIGAKIAALPLVTKVVACIVAGVIAIGGCATAVILSQKRNSEPTNNQSVVSSENNSSNDDTNSSSEENNTTATDNSSTDTTTNDGSSSNSNSSNDTSSNKNSANSGNPSNTSSGNNTSNSSDTESDAPSSSEPEVEEIQYCNESLIIERNFTPETYLASVMDFYNNNEFESFSPSPYTDHSAAFSENDLANGFEYFDILGYASASKNFPLCDFSVSRDGNQNFIKFSSFSINKSCTFKTEADVVKALKRDIDKFTRFLGDLGCSYYYRDKTTMKSVSSFTDDMLSSIAKGDNSDLKIEITAKNTFNFGNDEKRFRLTLKCSKTDYGYFYSIQY